MYKLRFLTPVMFLLVVAGFSAILMLLWNWLIPTIFGWSVINFWQALGLLALCRLLFGNFRVGHGRRHWEMRRGMGHHRNHLHEKWLKMTPEQRKEFFNKRRDFFNKSRTDFRRGGFFGESDFDPFVEDENTHKNNE